MCAARKSEFFRTVAFRLTVWYSVVFAILVIAILGVIYFAQRHDARRQIDRALSAEIEELHALARAQGLSAVIEELSHDLQAAGPDALRVRILTRSGMEIAVTDSLLWQALRDQPPASLRFTSRQTRWATIHIPSARPEIRVATAELGHAHIVQVAGELRNDWMLDLLHEEVAILAAAILLLAGLGGWFMARHAMSGVERVTQTAVRIEQGDLTQRVPPGGEGVEIDRLAMAFNAMVERVQSMVSEWKEVTSNIAHDLRSPITRMRGMAETTLTGAPQLDAYRDMASGVVEECDRLISMISTMLAIAEAESGVAVPARKLVDVAAILRDATDLFQPVADEKGVRLEVTLPADPLIVPGDASLLQRVVANLLDNAVKYAAGGGQVHLSGQSSRSQVTVSIADTGPGISEKDLPHVFERFYRGEPSRSTPGNGLGLSLAQALVRAHGGTITVQSSPGRGSRFVVNFPRE